MIQAQTVGATFTVIAAPPPTNYTLSIVPTGSGTISSSPAGISCGTNGSTCSTSFLSGSLITLTSVADSGSLFTGWNGACTGTGACTVNMTQAQTVGATFVIAVINGSCGSSDKGSFSSSPMMNLCSAGSLDSMTGTTSWSWSCKGIGGGTNMSCSADHTPGIPIGIYAPSYTGSTYYVDQTLGNDANSGTILSPWKTLAKAKTAVLNSGDALLLKCGETWRE